MRAFLIALAVALSMAAPVGADATYGPEDPCVETEQGARPVGLEIPSVTPHVDPNKPEVTVIVQGPGLYFRVTVNTACIG